jgi:hypothetical protein
MARESGNAKRLGKENVRIPPRVLEIAKWPEQDAEEEWNLEKWETSNRTAQAQAPVLRFFHDETEQHESDQPELAAEGEASDWNDEWRDEWRGPVRGESLSHPAAAGANEREYGHKLTKIAGGIVAGLLLIGGGLYAYQTSPAQTSPTQTSSASAPRKLAMKMPVAANTQSADEISAIDATQPAARPAPQSVLPRIVSPSVPQPDVSFPALRPVPEEAAAPTHRTAQISHRRERRARTGALDYGSSDPIDAPMTLTPETAPPPQQPAVTRLSYQPARAR